MAEVVRQEGAKMWARLVPDMAAGAASENPVLAELSCLVLRFVAEDVAVYNSDIVGGRMKVWPGGWCSPLIGRLLAQERGGFKVRLITWPGGRCSPCHRVTFNSGDRGAKCVG
jgi:hypothetical protein